MAFNTFRKLRSKACEKAAMMGRGADRLAGLCKPLRTHSNDLALAWPMRRGIRVTPCCPCVGRVALSRMLCKVPATWQVHLPVDTLVLKPIHQAPWTCVYCSNHFRRKFHNR